MSVKSHCEKVHTTRPPSGGFPMRMSAPCLASLAAANPEAAGAPANEAGALTLLWKLSLFLPSIQPLHT
jgi:hypothetical protein